MSDIAEPSQKELVQCLEWQLAMGVDVSVLETAADRTLAPAPYVVPKPPKHPTVAQASKPASELPHADIPRTFDLRAKFKNASTLKELRLNIEKFDLSSLKTTATQLVFGEGAIPADVMVIGEAPGQEEDETGRPFVGPSGQLLENMLTAAGLARFEVSYITNILPWRPPGNRTPSDDEVITFLPACLRHIELVAPKLIISLGGVSTKALLNMTTGITKCRGKFFPIDHELQLVNAEASSHHVLVMPTFHPAYLLRNPKARRDVWRDFLETRLKLDSLTQA